VPLPRYPCERAPDEKDCARSAFKPLLFPKGRAILVCCVYVYKHYFAPQDLCNALQALGNALQKLCNAS
jgi:hypothetical protein